MIEVIHIIHQIEQPSPLWWRGLHKAISLVIQTFERTYKSLITAGYRLGLHNSISLYIYIIFIAGSSQAFIFVLPGPKITSFHVLLIKVYPKRQL